jgi:hypothetical protein
METKLKNAILKQIGVTEKEFKNEIESYYNASSGINGFIYYSDTHEFAIKNQKLIINFLANEYHDTGVEPYDFVKNLYPLKDNLELEDLKDLNTYLSGSKLGLEQGQLTNTIAWFCVESLAFNLSN